MKKGLLYLLMFVMAGLSFTACSDDDDPNWKKLPNEITGENADLQINGLSTGGTVRLEAKNASTAILRLNNVIPGCETVGVEVEMTEQQDGSFNFQGNQTVEGIEVRSVANTGKSKYDVNINGNITLLGKIKASITIKLLPASLNGHIYNGANLKLTYSEHELTGKQVVFGTTDGQTGSLTLAGIIPGEPTAVISEVALTVDGFKCNFTGNATTTAGTQIAYSGFVLGDTLNLNLKATLSATALGGLDGRWDIFPSIEKENKQIVHAPAYVNWVSSYTSPMLGMTSTDQLSPAVRLMASNLIAQVLHNVTLEKDGSIKAMYYPTLTLPSDPMEIANFLMNEKINIPEDRKWETSPANLAFWYVKDNKFYLVPDIPMILQQVAKDGGKLDFGDINIPTLLESLQTMSGEEIKELLTDFLAQFEINLNISSLEPTTIKEIVGWLSTGIPLNYQANGTGLTLYLDKETINPLMSQLLLPMLPALNTAFKAQLEEMYPGQGTDMYVYIMVQFLGVLDLEEISGVWGETTDFSLGLEFKK